MLALRLLGDGVRAVDGRCGVFRDTASDGPHDAMRARCHVRIEVRRGCCAAPVRFKALIRSDFEREPLSRSQNIVELAVCIDTSKFF